MDLINVIGTFFDNSMQHIIALANLIKDLRLEKNLLEINLIVEENILEINSKLNNILEEISSTGNSNIAELLLLLTDRLILIELNPKSFKHILITKEAYDLLESYEKDTLYLIVENSEETSHFGDTFPFILGRSSSKFGDNFPLIFN